MNRILCLSLAAALSLSSIAHAVPVIVVGDHDLLPNTPGQNIDIFVFDAGPLPNGGQGVQGANLNALLGDGGPDFGGFDIPGINIPVLGGGDLIAPGTIFAVSNTGLRYEIFPPFNLIAANTTTDEGTAGYVNPNGLLTVLTVDTTGLFEGSWPLKLFDTFAGPTNFTAFVPIDITDGSITIVPEPSTLVLAAFGLVGLAAWGWQRKR
jgi:hypothetical protein